MVKNIPEHLLHPVRIAPLLFKNGDIKESGAMGVILNEDEKEKVVGIVSKKYNLVKNEELLDALNDASEEIGIDFIFNKSLYAEKMSGYRYHQYYIPLVADIKLSVEDEDGSLLNPVVEIENSYDGTKSWGINVCGYRSQDEVFFYVLRQICSNGMVGQVRINVEEYRGNEQIYVGTESKVEEEITEIVRVRHVLGRKHKKELIKKKILQGFENNKLVEKFIEKAYEKATKKWLEALKLYVEKVNSVDLKLLEPAFESGLEGFKAVQLFTYLLTHVIKARSYERYKLYQQKMWESLK